MGRFYEKISRPLSVGLGSVNSMAASFWLVGPLGGVFMKKSEDLFLSGWARKIRRRLRLACRSLGKLKKSIKSTPFGR